MTGYESLTTVYDFQYDETSGDFLATGAHIEEVPAETVRHSISAIRDIEMFIDGNLPPDNVEIYDLQGQNYFQSDSL